MIEQIREPDFVERLLSVGHCAHDCSIEVDCAAREYLLNAADILWWYWSNRAIELSVSLTKYFRRLCGRRLNLMRSFDSAVSTFSVFVHSPTDIFYFLPATVFSYRWLKSMLISIFFFQVYRRWSCCSCIFFFIFVCLGKSWASRSITVDRSYLLDAHDLFNLWSHSFLLLLSSLPAG